MCECVRVRSVVAVQRGALREREGLLRAYAGKRACCCVCVERWLYRLPLSVERERL